MPEGKEVNQMMLRSLSTLRLLVLGEELKNEPIGLFHIYNQLEEKKKETPFFLMEGVLFELCIIVSFLFPLEIKTSLHI